MASGSIAGALANTTFTWDITDDMDATAEWLLHESDHPPMPFALMFRHSTGGPDTYFP